MCHVLGLRRTGVVGANRGSLLEDTGHCRVEMARVVHVWTALALKTGQVVAHVLYLLFVVVDGATKCAERAVFRFDKQVPLLVDSSGGLP